MRAGPRRRPAADALAPPTLLVAALLGVWELYARTSGVSPFVLPAPSQVVGSLWAFRAEAVRHLVPTIVETVVGFGLSIAFATAVAVALDRVGWARRAVEPLLVGSQTVPLVAVAPLVIVWFGFGLLPKVLVVILVTFFPITIGLLDGFRSTPADAAALMRSFGASPSQAFRKLRWPSGLPAFFTGLRISATYAVLAAVIAEYVGATEGLGIWIQLSQRSFRTDLVFAAILLTGVVSVALYAVVIVAERLAIPWWSASRASGERAWEPSAAEPAP
jgi:ABC-type nitrate/sulfonate/bicarbonate transport system permease component